MKRIIIILALLLAIAAPAHALSLTDFTTRVRVYLYETDSSNTIYEATMFTEAANRAHTALLDLLPYSANPQLLATTSTTVYTGATSTAFSTSTIRKILAMKHSGKPIIQTKPSEYYARALAASTKDPVFSVVGSYIQFAPAIAATTAVELLYQKRVRTLSTGTDTFETLAEYDNLLVLLGAYHILMQDNQPTRAAALEKLVTYYVQLVQNAIVNTNVVEPVGGGK